MNSQELKKPPTAAEDVVDENEDDLKTPTVEELSFPGVHKAVSSTKNRHSFGTNQPILP